MSLPRSHSSPSLRRFVRQSLHVKTAWRIRASIPVPLACKASALPCELIPLHWQLPWLGHRASEGTFTDRRQTTDDRRTPLRPCWHAQHWPCFQQSGAEEACWAHNPEVGGSKPPSATYRFFRPALELPGFLCKRKALPDSSLMRGL